VLLGLIHEAVGPFQIEEARRPFTAQLKVPSSKEPIP